MTSKIGFTRTFRELLAGVLAVPVCAAGYLLLAWLASRVVDLPLGRLTLAYGVGTAIISAGIILALHATGEVRSLGDSVRVALGAALLMAGSLAAYFAISAPEPLHPARRIAIAAGLCGALVLFHVARQNAREVQARPNGVKGVASFVGGALLLGFVALRLTAWNVLVIAALCVSLIPGSTALFVARRKFGLARANNDP